MKISLPRSSDLTVVNAFISNTLDSRKEFGLTENAFVNICVGGMSIDGLRRGASNQVIDNLKATESFGALISSIALYDSSKYGGNGLICRLTRPEGSLVDVFETEEGHNFSEKFLKIALHINRSLHAESIEGEAPQLSSSTEMIAAHHQVLTGLESVSSQLIEKNIEHSNRLEQEKREFVNRQTNEHASKLAKLDQSYSERLQELEEQHQEKSKELDERQKKIDDADNTTARRITTSKALDEAKEVASGFKFSSNVEVRAWLAVFFCFTLFVFGGYISWSAINEIKSIQGSYIHFMNHAGVVEDNYSPELPQINSFVEASNYFLYFRALIGAALAVSSLVYLIRWFNTWANKLAYQELESQQFIRDLNRAHLAVEMALEWNDKKESALPEKLLDAMTKDLFRSKDAPAHDLKHPADQIASALLKTSDKISLPFGEANIETSGKGLKKADAAHKKSN